MAFIKRNIVKVATLFYVLFAPVISFASCDPGKLCNPINQSTIMGLIKSLLEGLIKIGMPVIALAMIYCGFLFVSATGNTEKIKTAKETLLYTLLGAVILLGSWAIAQLISSTVLAL